MDSGLSSRAASYDRHTTQVHVQAGSTATHDPQPILSARSHVPPPCGTTSHDLAHAASREHGFLPAALYLTRVKRAKRDSREDIFFVVVELLPRCGGETYPRVSVVAKEWLSNYVTRVHVSARTVIWKYVSRFTQSTRTSDEEDSSDAFFKTCLFVYKIMA